MIWHLSQILTLWWWKFTSKPVLTDWLTKYVCLVFTGWLCQMLRVYRPGYRQSVCCENYSTHSCLQTSPERKGVFLSHTVTRLVADSHPQSAKLLFPCLTDWQRNWTAQNPSPQTHRPVLLPLRGQGQYLHPSWALQQTSKSQHYSPIHTVQYQWSGWFSLMKLRLFPSLLFSRWHMFWKPARCSQNQRLGTT